MKLFTAVSALAACVLITPLTAFGEPVIDFGLVAPTTGSISYAGGTAPMVGSAIQVDNVVGVGTPVQNSVLRNCLNCVLTFSTGDLLSTSAGGWTFAGGGNITISGTVDLNANNVIDAGDATGTLLSGHFGTANASLFGGTFTIVGASFAALLNTSLTNFYGTDPMPFTYQGGLNLSFLSSVNPAGGFSSLTLLSGDVVGATPEPTSIVLLGTVVLGCGILTRRRLRKV